MAHVRSPAYPSLHLETALKRARELYGHENRAPAAFDVVLAHWGYKPTTGPGQVALAALRHFGLISVTGSGEERQVKLTDLALSILLDEVPDSPERAKAIRKSALLPKIHAQLWKKWSFPLPSEPNMRTHLVRDLKFNEKSVSGFLKDYRKTILFAKLDSAGTLSEDTNEKLPTTIVAGDYVQWTSQGAMRFSDPKRVTRLSEDGEWAFIAESETGMPIGELTKEDPPVSPKTPPRNPDYVPGTQEPGVRQFPLYLSPDRKAVLTVPAAMSQEELEQLSKQMAFTLQVVGTTTSIVAHYSGLSD